jgi:hypothetical protein
MKPHRSVCVSAIIATLMLVPPAVSGQSAAVGGWRTAEDFSFLAGRWRAEPAFREAVGPRPRFVNVLEITTSPTEIRVDRGYSPVETYRLDGTITDFGNGFVGWALPIADGVLLTTRRVSRPTLTTHADVYRLVGDQLIMDSRRSQTQPDGTLVAMKDTRVTIAYRRIP